MMNPTTTKTAQDELEELLSRDSSRDKGLRRIQERASIIQCKKCGVDVLRTGCGHRKYCKKCGSLKIKDSQTCVCIWCGKTFVPVRKVAKLCSGSCSSSWVQATGQGQQRRYTKEQLLEKIREAAEHHNRPITLDDLANHTGVTEKILRRYKLSLPKELVKLGYTPSKNNVVSADGELFGSHFEMNVYNALKVLFPGIRIKKQKTFTDCVGLGGAVCRFDFYLKDKNLIVEADGNQHYTVGDTKPHFDDPREHDKIKNAYCEYKGIQMVRIRYFRRVDQDAFVRRVRTQIEKQLKKFIHDM